MPAPLSRRLAAEVVGTFGFFFTGFCGIAAFTTQTGSISSLGIAAGFGFGLALMIFAFGHISGGHYNPAVTLGLALARRFPSKTSSPTGGRRWSGASPRRRCCARSSTRR